jgi:hypothetical protein
VSVLLPSLVLAGIGIFCWLLARSRELFRIQIRDGVQTLTRGYAPSGLLDDFQTAVRRVRRGTIRAYRSGDFARLELRGDIGEDAAQRLRNLVSLYPLARLRGPRA